MERTNRRNFIKTSLAASGAIVTCVSAGCQESQSRQVYGDKAVEDKAALKIGLMTYNLGRNWDIETIIKNCSEAKFAHVELRTTHAHKVEVNLTKQQRQDIAKRFADSEMEAISFASGFSYHHEDPAVLRKNIEGTKEYIILASDVGARGIRVFPNAIPDGPEAAIEKTCERIAKAVSEVSDFGADHGVQIRLANHGRGTNRIRITRKILDYADNDNVYVNWNCDPTDTEQDGFESNFDLVRGRIGNVHLHSLYNEDYPYRRLFELLRESGYSGYCDAEIPESCEPVRLMKYYRALFLAYQSVL